MITLEQVKREFPVGTTFKCAVDGEVYTMTEEDEIIDFRPDEGTSFYTGTSTTSVFLYDNGKKAEIINSPLYEIFN